ncbi:MAG: AEC family transporter [Pelagimonas sp.]|jgi:predicted permease|nr:AEC family transporter [Pelagimonas sp.]
MQALLDVILPVFLVIGAGYGASWRGWLTQDAIDGIMAFASNIAIPALLFKAISSLELGGAFDPWILISFYAGSLTCFFIGLFAARHLFHRPWEDSVAIGFCCLFANSVMLGLAVTERAFGTGAALEANYMIVALHSPFCYGIGITAMEIARARGTPARALPGKVLRAMFRNALVIGITLGVLANLANLSLPTPANTALNMIVTAALPAALFGTGGVLYRYRPDGDLRVIAMICTCALIIHPSIAWTIGSLTGISTNAFRSVVLTASMAPGINTYIFANMYGVARRVAASSVLIATSLSVVSVWFWLSVLP